MHARALVDSRASTDTCLHATTRHPNDSSVYVEVGQMKRSTLASGSALSVGGSSSGYKVEEKLIAGCHMSYPTLRARTHFFVKVYTII